jgi:hypothetical protein
LTSLPAPPASRSLTPSTSEARAPFFTTRKGRGKGGGEGGGRGGRRSGEKARSAWMGGSM